jgi:DNA-binding SARP family transcriptional activator/WD40 repeat protein
MRIAVLGPLEVTTDDRAPGPLPGGKERLLLAVLAARAPAVVSTDALAEAMWDGDPPVSARKSLQAHVVRLRSALEPGRPKGSSGRYVVRRGTGYALAVGRSDVDALLMVDRAARGHADLAAGDVTAAERDLASAVALWRGEPYADWPDAPFAEPERRRLLEVRAGALVGLLEARLQLGRHTEVLPELENRVAEEPLREDWWRLLVLALYRAGRQADALAAVRRVRAVLSDELGAEPGPALRQLEAAILAQDPALDLPSAPAPATAAQERSLAVAQDLGACPYKGLATYQLADAPLFHGRRRLVSALVARLVDAPLVVVSGPSGAGKSSVVRAGLVPALVDGALPGSRSWTTVLVTPGRRPVDALARLTGEQPPAAPVLLICDQFEEVWGSDVDPAERTAFLDAILGLLDDGVVVRCVLVVRGDHVGRLAEHAAFAEQVGGALVLVPPLTEAELREVVREPAAAVGLLVEPELLDAAVADGLGRPGALPLLSTAMVGTWERRSGNVLTLAGYLRSGGVAGALTRSAEAAYGALDGEGRETARRLLVRLADVDEGGTLVRRRVPLAELELDGEGGARRRAVVEAFVRRRLLAVDAGRLDVAHEALFTAWSRLGQWLQEDAVGRVVRRHLDPAARDWAAAGRPDDELYRGARLAAALDWAAAADADLTPVERQFLAASRARADADLTAARERADVEASGRRRTRRLAAGLAAVLVVAVVAAVLAVRSAGDAQLASVQADANRLATLAVSTGFTDLSLLLAVQGLRLADLPETRGALLGTLAGHGRAERVATYPEGIDRLAVDSDGTVLTESRDGGTFEWSPEDAGPVRPARQDETWLNATNDWDAAPEGAVLAGVGWSPLFEPWVGVRSRDGSVRSFAQGEPVGGQPLAASFTGDGSGVLVLLGHGEGFRTPGPTTWSLAEFDVADGSRRDLDVGGPLDGRDLSARVDIADAGSTVVAPGAGSAGTLVDVGRRTQVPLLPPSKAATATGFRALAGGAAQMWSDGEVTLYGMDGRIRQRLNAAAGAVNDVVLAPDRTWAATVGSGGGIVLWDVDPDSGVWVTREQFVGHEGSVVDAEVNADSRQLVTLGLDDRVVVWDATRDGGFGRPVRGLGDRLTVGPPQVLDPGRLLVAPTASAGATGGEVTVHATFFRPTTGEVAAEVPIGTVPAGESGPLPVSVSPDQRMVAMSTGSTVAVVDAVGHRILSRYTPPPVGTATGHPVAATVGCLAWSPPPTRLLVCSDDEDEFSVVAAVDPVTGGRVGGTSLGILLNAMATSRDGHLLAAAAVPDSRAGLVVFDAGSLELLQYVSLRGRGVAWHVSFSPDGRRIAITGQDGLVVVDTTSWAVAQTPAPLRGALLQAEWFSDSRTLAVVGEDRTLFLYDVRQRQVTTLPVPTSGPGASGDVRLVPGISDELIVLGGEEGGRRYPLDEAAWSARACAVAGRDLTEQEWKRYLPDRPYQPTCSDLG